MLSKSYANYFPSSLFQQQQQFPWPNQQPGLMGPPPPSATAATTTAGGPEVFHRDLPPASDEDIELIAHDPYKSINIDNHPREIR